LTFSPAIPLLSFLFVFFFIFEERKYMDAKRFTEEIKLLTEEGEEKQHQVEQIKTSLKHNKNEVELIEKQLEENKKIFNAKLKEFGEFHTFSCSYET